MKTVDAGGQRRDENAQHTAARRTGSDGKFFTKVNGVEVKFSDASPKGERILDRAGFQPVSMHVLIQLMRHSSRSIGLDETVDLSAPGTEDFRAFKSDRIFRFVLNDHGFEWGIASITEPELREIAHVPDDYVVVLERDGDYIELSPADVLDLSKPSTEHLHTEKRLITVFFENEPREISRGIYTTEHLKKLFGVQEGYILEFIDREGNLTPLKPNAKLRVKDGMRFFEQVPCGASS
ncbi:multiubiquitin domain-containing protein [Bradyrhizobium yuanmingense]|uniref:multiubiquitin domain-containing protein n=1 Tax=Bradyrhizobium yuanmingense TaxID=108015 RepID=UPI0023B9704B|nr:multiubiquitin domain-containing protein [Bradyrhizobium yuanmingense]MDF0523313.1 multiubiquitin domain-containing protein [Bradyrhizobium yuanmingense]